MKISRAPYQRGGEWHSPWRLSELSNYERGINNPGALLSVRPYAVHWQRRHRDATYIHEEENSKASLMLGFVASLLTTFYQFVILRHFLIENQLMIHVPKTKLVVEYIRQPGY